MDSWILYQRAIHKIISTHISGIISRVNHDVSSANYGYYKTIGIELFHDFLVIFQALFMESLQDSRIELYLQSMAMFQELWMELFQEYC